MQFNRLIPELTVRNIAAAKDFYMELLGFQLEYERPCDSFAFLSLDGAQLMLEEYRADGWNVAGLEPPFGRGVNFSMEVDDLDRIYGKLLSNNYPLYRPLMTSRYETDGRLITQKEFLVQDPDGYLLRFTQEQSHHP